MSWEGFGGECRWASVRIIHRRFVGTRSGVAWNALARSAAG